MPQAAPVSRMEENGPFAQDAVVVVFDTDCVLCSALVRFLLRHERDRRMVFVKAWTVRGLSLASSHGLSRADLRDTFLVIENGRPLVRSAATLALLKRLKAPWRWLRGLRMLLPRNVRDWLYDEIAQNRYSLFGFRRDCFVPSGAEGGRFLGSEPRKASRHKTRRRMPGRAAPGS